MELEKEFTSRTNDKKKFENYFLHYEGRKKKVLDSIAREEQDIAVECKQILIKY